MAQPADGLTMEEAHTKIKTKITEIEGFIQRHKMVGSLGSEQRAEAGALQRKLEHRLLYLKILWYAEPNDCCTIGVHVPWGKLINTHKHVCRVNKSVASGH